MGPFQRVYSRAATCCGPALKYSRLWGAPWIWLLHHLELFHLFWFASRRFAFCCCSFASSSSRLAFMISSFFWRMTSSNSSAFNWFCSTDDDDNGLAGWSFSSICRWFHHSSSWFLLLLSFCYKVWPWLVCTRTFCRHCSADTSADTWEVDRCLNRLFPPRLLLSFDRCWIFSIATLVVDPPRVYLCVPLFDAKIPAVSDGPHRWWVPNGVLIGGIRCLQCGLYKLSSKTFDLLYWSMRWLAAWNKMWWYTSRKAEETSVFTAIFSNHS